MALGLFGSKTAADADHNSNSSDEKVSKPDKAYDAEAGLGRIEQPSRRDVGSEEDSITIGKQIEMEAENAIKYRTCSWPKVRHSSYVQRIRSS